MVTSFILLYFGPEAFLPFASAVAGIVGALLIFWRVLVSKVRKFFRIFSRKPAAPAPSEPTLVTSELESDYQQVP